MTEAAAVKADVRVALGNFDLALDFAAPGRGITGILGPSGSGKTTLLRCIAGLEPACRGTVTAGGEVWQDASRFAPAHARPTGFVFQDARLFPHLTVRRNLEYGARRARGGAVGFDETVELLGVRSLLARMPAGLSAGEAQRVAIGRALLRQPRVLLMDEPLANLDPDRRHEVLPFLERLHDRLTLPILYVSHGIDELARVCDHLVLLHGGRVQAAGPLREILARGDLPGGLGEECGAVLDGVVQGFDAADELTEIDTDAGRLLVAGRQGAVGHRVRLRILARDVSVTLAPPVRTSILNVLPAVIEGIEPCSGGRVDLVLRTGNAMLRARISRRSCALLGLQPGQQCHAQVKGVAVKGGSTILESGQ